MADVLKFPEAYGRLLASGKKKLSAKEYLAAKKDFLQAYELSMNFESCRLVVVAMRELGEVEDALTFMEDHLDEFLSDHEGIETYGRLLLLNQKYLSVHRLLKNDPSQKNLQQALDQIERAQVWLDHATIYEKEKQLCQMAHSQKPIDKKAWQNLTTGVSLVDFKKICERVLADVANPFLAPKIFEELVRDGATGTIDFKKEHIDLAELWVLQEMPAFKAALTTLENEACDPQVLDLAQAELTGHFALLYPILPDQAEAKQWARSYLLEIGALFGTKTKAATLINYPEIQEKKAKLRQIYQEI